MSTLLNNQSSSYRKQKASAAQLSLIERLDTIPAILTVCTFRSQPISPAIHHILAHSSDSGQCSRSSVLGVLQIERQYTKELLQTCETHSDSNVH